MPKFKMTWSEVREIVLEAESEDEAYEMLWQGHDEPSTFVMTTDYSCEQVEEEDDDA